MDEITQEKDLSNETPIEDLPGEKKGLIYNRLLSRNNIIIGVIAILIFFLIFILSTLFKANVEPINDISEKIDQANIAYKNGNLEEAERLLVESYQQFPSDPNLQSALISIIANGGNQTGSELDSYQKSLPYIEKALRDNPNNYDVLLAVGYANETAGNYSEALSYYEQALVIDPEGARALFHKGHVLEFLNRQEEAFAYYERAYALDKNDPDVLLAKAKISLLNQNVEDAISFYEQIGSSTNATASLRAEALTNASRVTRSNILDLESSISLARSAVEADNTFSPALGEYGFVLGMNNQTTEGIMYLKKAIEANPRISQNYWWLGALYRISGDFQSAIPYHQQAVEKIDSDNTILDLQTRSGLKAGMLYDLASDYTKIDQDDKALTFLVEAVNLNPNLKERLKRDTEVFEDFSELRGSIEFESLLP